jgi:hypothetical protein
MPKKVSSAVTAKWQVLTISSLAEMFVNFLRFSGGISE